jgi:hypothetical protein
MNMIKSANIILQVSRHSFFTLECQKYVEIPHVTLNDHIIHQNFQYVDNTILSILVHKIILFI